MYSSVGMLSKNVEKWLCFRSSLHDYEVEGWDELPADIVGALFDKSERRKDAKNIRLVCRAWREACKFHIKSIVLKTHGPFPYQVPVALPALSDISLGDVRSCDELLHLLEKLPFLTRLNVHSTRDFTCPNSIEPPKCGSLQDLTIGSCSPFVPISEAVNFATLFPSLLRLRILRLGPCGADTSSFSRLTSLSKLLELEIPTATNIDDNFLASMSLTKLVYGYSESLKAQNLRLGTSLQHLSLPCCAHSQTFMFSDLAQVTCLELRGAQIVDDDLRHLSRLVNLCTLRISSCKYLLGSGLSQLHPLSSLRYLDISHCWAVDDEGMLGLGLLTSLTDVRMSGCRYVTHVGARALTSLTNMRHLDVSDCHAINYNGVGWIFQMLHLKTVNFARTPISLPRSAEATAVPSQIPPVETMDLTETGKIGVLIPFLMNMTGLRCLNMSGVWGSDTGLSACLLAMNNLTSLDLGSSASVNDDLLKSIGKISSLVSLGVSGCTELTDKGLSRLRALGRLSSLGVTLSRGIWLNWIGKMPSLTRLDVSQSEILARHHLRRISRLQNLTHLICSGCNYICVEAFSKLRGLRYLETVDVRGLESAKREEVRNVFMHLDVKVL
ncbi:hypothetical protein BSKO_09892 [Bryopsis sp. KO-2023]|nr:hypothetical protein BSKO_09892 [Bryopsis sp. KO-2023]